jgi:hypothetical protein
VSAISPAAFVSTPTRRFCLVSVYSSGAIGGLVLEDVISMIRCVRSQTAAASLRATSDERPEGPVSR